MMNLTFPIFFSADAIAFYEPGSVRSSVLNYLEADSPLMGWANGDESSFIGLTSETGRFVVPADHAHNLAPLSGIVEGSLTQVALADYVVPPVETGVHYVTFVLSDGDNVQWLLGEHASDSQQKWWSNPNRGATGVGYGLPPSMIDLSPAALKWYYENATSNDVFMVGPSGSGYMYPSKYPNAELDLHLIRLNDYMERCDLNLVEVIDFGVLDDMALWDKYASLDMLDGIIYLEYSSHKAHEGKLRWSRGKPIITPRYIVSAGSEQEVINAINARPRDPSSPDSYSLVFVHAWSENLDHMKIVSDGLDAAVKVVTPKAMVDLIKRNIQPDVIFDDAFDTSVDWTMVGDAMDNVGSITIGSGGGHIETTTAITTVGYYSLGVEFELAMMNLDTGDSLVVEYDAGFGTWLAMMTFDAGSVEVDGNTHHFTHQLPAVANDGSIKLRFRVLSQPLLSRRLAKPECGDHTCRVSCDTCPNDFDTDTELPCCTTATTTTAATTTGLPCTGYCLCDDDTTSCK